MVYWSELEQDYGENARAVFFCIDLVSVKRGEPLIIDWGEKLAVHHQTWILSDDIPRCWSYDGLMFSGPGVLQTVDSNRRPAPPVHLRCTRSPLDRSSCPSMLLVPCVHHNSRQKRQSGEINKQIMELMRCALMQDRPLTAASCNLQQY